jgi:hypothetical protein
MGRLWPRLPLCRARRGSGWSVGGRVPLAAATANRWLALVAPRPTARMTGPLPCLRGGSRLGPLRKPPACQQAWEAAEPLHGPPAPALRLAVESDVPAETFMAAVTDEAADPLVLMKTSCRSRERPWVGPPPRAAHPWRSTTALHRLLPQLTGIVGPVGVALSYPSTGTPQGPSGAVVLRCTSGDMGRVCAAGCLAATQAGASGASPSAAARARRLRYSSAQAGQPAR